MPARRGLRLLPVVGFILVAGATLGIVHASGEDQSKEWTDKDLVASYAEFGTREELREAVLSPSLPSEPPQKTFLEALAWLAAGSPNRAGTLTLGQLDDFIGSQAGAYIALLESKVERGTENDFARTRTWKVIQKLTLLRNDMVRPGSGGTFSFPEIDVAPFGDDAWEREHTLGSVREFQEKVCRGSHERPVLVKFGNTNCTQCMLFEMTGSVKAFAENPEVREVADVYKVWWGLKPDDSFAGKLRNPERLDELVKAEGVRSSPTFMVYRNGRPYHCGGAFPTGNGSDEELISCIRMQFPDRAPSEVCSRVSPVAVSSF